MTSATRHGDRRAVGTVWQPVPAGCARTPVGPGRGRCGYLLLEVVIALGLLVVGLSAIGMQVQTSYETTHETARMLRAMNLAESKMAELESGLILDIDSAIEDDLEEEFGRLFPDFAWRLRLDPTETPELWAVRLDILHLHREDVDEEFDFDGAAILFTIRTLRASPATIDPEKDFGADEEAMQQLVDALAGTEIDPYAIDLQQIGQLPMEQLLELLTAFEDAGLLEGVNLGSFLPPEIMQLLDEARGEPEDTGTGGLGDGPEVQ